MTFFAVVTELGRPKIAASMIPGGAPLAIASMALGDGGGAAVTPSANRAALLNEVYRRPVDGVSLHPANDGRITVECTIPLTDGGWTIREYGLYDASGDLIIYGNFPETYKPVLIEGVGRDLTLRQHIFVGTGANVTMLIDPSATLATREYVNTAIMAALLSNRPFRYFRNQGV